MASILLLVLTCGVGTAEDTAPIAFVDAPYLVRAGHDTEATFEIRVTNTADGSAERTLVVSASRSIKLAAQRFPVTFAKAGAQQAVTLAAAFPKKTLPGEYYLTAMMDTVPEPAHALVRVLELALPEGINVGVLQVEGMAWLLGRLEAPHAALDSGELTANTLRAFSAVVVGPNAYASCGELTARNEVLLKYVKHGGTLVVMDQDATAWNDALAPYPLGLRARAPVEGTVFEPLVARHARQTRGCNPLSFPNAVGPLDWVDWRPAGAVAVAESRDEAYGPLIACTTQEEDDAAPCCLVAKYGKGTYVYAGLNWQAQLADLHPGAIRLLVNLLAL